MLRNEHVTCMVHIMKKITLSEYIATFDDDGRAASVLGITERSAAAYRRGERAPRRKDLPGLIERSNGFLSYQSFYPEQK